MTREQRKAKQKAYDLAHREEARARKKRTGPQYWLDHREEITQKRKAKRDAETPEQRQARLARQLQYLHTYRERHKERLQAQPITPEHRQKNRQRMAAWRQANPERNQAAQRRQREQNGEKIKAQDRARKAARTPEEKAAYAEKRAAQRLANLEIALAKERAYNRTHPEIRQAGCARRRARKAGAPINDLTPDQWQEIKAAFGYRCAYQASPGCQGRVMKHLTQDHILPLSKGGSHTATNIVPACRACNSKKHVNAPLIPVQPLLLTVASTKKKKA